MTIFGAFDGHTAAAAATVATVAAAATATCRTYHSQTNFYIIAFVAASSRGQLPRHTHTHTQRERNNAALFLFLYKLHATGHSAFHAPPPARLLLPHTRLGWASTLAASTRAALDSNCHLMRHARHLRTTHDYQFAQAQRFASITIRFRPLRPSAPALLPRSALIFVN